MAAIRDHGHAGILSDTPLNPDPRFRDNAVGAASYVPGTYIDRRQEDNVNRHGSGSPAKVRFAPNSPLEEGRFEPSVLA